MLKKTLHVHTIQTIVVLLIQSLICDARKIVVGQCNKAPPSCGHIHNISYPFRLKGQPQECGEPKYELLCENNKTVIFLNSVKYYVEAINRKNYTVRLVDAIIQRGDCSSIPLRSVTPATFSLQNPDHLIMSRDELILNSNNGWSNKVIFLSCENALSNSSMFIQTEPCVNGSTWGWDKRNRYSYVVSEDAKMSDLEESCSVELMVLNARPMRCGLNCSYREIHDDVMAYGFELSWDVIVCQECKGKGFCYLENDGNAVYGCDDRCGFMCIVVKITSKMFEWLFFFGIYGLGPLILLRFAIGMLLFSGLLVYKWRRRHLSMYDSVEEFLQSHNNLRPIKYSFSEIKNMTKGFKDKLGEGGYGCVYKGKLRSGHDVAIKVLGKSKANGQEFINEVATIGRIHHVHVVRLIGFCAEGSKRALVYEYMPNGSLEKHIFPREGKVSLSYEKMYEISLGVARGIEYLHKGCHMRILHFDIKPHNILLDENFIPKVSDFGLAKLYPTEGSIVSLTAATGTIGYIAPEFFYKNIGGVSYKADVYSFGMLLLEMAGKRRTLNAMQENSSQTYFPSWVYDQISKGKDLEIEDVTGNEIKIVRKMVIIGLWCIQMRPNDRPSMNRVIEMLESEIECLEMPPKPSLYPEDVLVKDVNDYSSNLTSSSIPSGDSRESSSLILNAN